MYFPPAKTAKTNIFPDTTLPLNDSKQLSQVSEKLYEILMRGFKENVQEIRNIIWTDSEI